MTRAREGGGAKAFFRRPRHQRLPTTEQGGKRKKLRRKTSQARAQRRRARAPPKKHEKETSRPRGNKEGKPRGKAAKRNRTDTHGEKMAVERKRAIGRRTKKAPAASALSLRGMMHSPRAKVEISFWCLDPEGSREGFGAAFAVHGGGNDATGVARPFTAGEESGEAHVLQGVVVAHHTNGRRSARFGGDEDRIVGEKTATATTEGFEALLQTLGDEARHPKVEG